MQPQLRALQLSCLSSDGPCIPPHDIVLQILSFIATIIKDNCNAKYRTFPASYFKLNIQSLLDAKEKQS